MCPKTLMTAYPKIFIKILPPKQYEYSIRHPYFTVGISQSQEIT